MSRFDEIKKRTSAARDVARAKIEDTDFRKVAGDAVLGASSLVEGAQSVAQSSGLTKKNGKISKYKLAKAAVRPGQTARKIFDATADEVRSSRGDATRPLDE